MRADVQTIQPIPEARHLLQAEEKGHHMLFLKMVSTQHASTVVLSWTSAGSVIYAEVKMICEQKTLMLLLKIDVRPLESHTLMMSFWAVNGGRESTQNSNEVVLKHPWVMDTPRVPYNNI